MVSRASHVGPKTAQICVDLSEAFQVILAVVEDHAAVGMIDPVIEIVAEVASTHVPADDFVRRRWRPKRRGSDLVRREFQLAGETGGPVRR